MLQKLQNLLKTLAKLPAIDAILDLLHDRDVVAFAMSIILYLPVSETTGNSYIMTLYIAGVLILLGTSAGRSLLAQHKDQIGMATQSLLDAIERLRIIGDIPDDVEKQLVGAVVKFIESLGNQGNVDNAPKG